MVQTEVMIELQFGPLGSKRVLWLPQSSPEEWGGRDGGGEASLLIVCFPWAVQTPLAQIPGASLTCTTSLHCHWTPFAEVA